MKNSRETKDMNDNPCVQVCVRDKETDICIGCGRLGSEIGKWNTLSKAERHTILQNTSSRLASLTDKSKRRRGGRAARVSDLEGREHP